MSVDKNIEVNIKSLNSFRLAILRRKTKEDVQLQALIYFLIMF